MIAFIIRRLLGALLVMFAITVLTFLIFFATPSNDPAARIAGRNASPETLKQVRHDFGLDRPLPVQYAIMMKKLLWSRDLTSFINRGAKITPQIADAAPVSFSLVIGAAIVWVFFAIAMGLTAAVMRGTFVDPLIMIIGLIGISMPVFWLGEVVNLITQDRFHDTFLFSWVPPLGYTPFTQDPWQWFLHLIFPWITLSILYIGFYARVLRADLLEVQNEDFVRTARAKGLSPRGVLVRHMLRTSLITFVSLFGLDFGVLVGGGALLIEVVFGLPGVGLLTYNALRSLDLPVIMATVIYGAFFITIMSALVDIVYARLDPRIRPA
jgi:peptide/nickel transport system permease protein